MKKSTLTVLLTVLVSLSMNAQHLGVKGGLNFSNLNLEDVDGELRLGYHAGVFLNVPLGEAFSLQPEVLFSSKGSRTTYNLETFSLEGESVLALNYIEVPILGVLNVGDVAQINFGPYLGFLSTASLELDGEIADNEFFESDELDQDNFRNLDYGVAAGIALNFGALQVGARYSLGLVAVEDSESAEIFLGDARNQNVQVYAALRLGDYD
jgi:hypothetical protein